MKILVLEDNNEDFRTLQSALRQYSARHLDRKIDLVHCRDQESFGKQIEDKPEGIVCDLRIINANGQQEDGNAIIKKFAENLRKQLYLVPLAILTNVPIEADDDPWVPVFTKAKEEYPKLFDHLWTTYKTGISEISGLNGKLLQKLKDIFSYAIEEHFDIWKEKIQKGKAPDTVQKSLQRYILAHMLYELSESEEKFQPEEFFIYTNKNKFDTGRIFKQGEKYFFLITPPCNLAQGGGVYHLLPIMSFSGKNADAKKSIRENKCFCTHYFPTLKGEFEECYLDFINIIVCKDLTQYTPSSYQVSPEFVKNIQSRFSSYYGRQGQPDMEPQ